MEHNITGKTPSNSSIDDMVKKLEKSLSVHSDIALVFLFGSFVKGDITSFSDLDIAIFFTGTINFYRINDLREDISEMLGVEVDIVVLNNASPVIKMQVLKKGTLLINKDQQAYNKFFVNTVKEYDDLKRTRKEIEEKILRGRIYA
jgi:predicted nucleotidyltransferase